jgi:tRNA modification GTPase
MRARALRAVEEADLVILVQDLTDPAPAPAVDRRSDVVVRTKSDLAPAIEHDGVSVSAHTGDGLPALRDRLDRLAFGERSARTSLALNARHVAAVHEAREALARAASATDGSPEVLALELREALDALGRVVGAVTPDDLLGRIFSTFCIGK